MELLVGIYRIIFRHMEPVYIDIHIHTLSNPDNLNVDYDVETLFSNKDKVFCFRLLTIM